MGNTECQFWAIELKDFFIYFHHPNMNVYAEHLDRLAGKNASFEDLAIYSKAHGITIFPEVPESKLNVLAWNAWKRVIKIVEKYDVKMTVPQLELLEQFLMSCADGDFESTKV